MTTDLRIVEDDLTGRIVNELVAFHLREMHANSPACSVHAMPANRLRQSDVTFYTAWRGQSLAGMGGLKHLADDHGELKSMRSAPDFARQGIGRATLRHLLAESRRRGYRRVSLETGTGPAFEPALMLYESEGFHPCPPFADYAEDPFSRFMTLKI